MGVFSCVLSCLSFVCVVLVKLGLFNPFMFAFCALELFIITVDQCDQLLSQVCW
jgi:hypothetical protein